MDFSTLSAGLRKGLETIKALAPLAAFGGPAVAGLAKIADSLATIGANVLEKIEDGTVVATSQDKAEVQKLLAEIQDENDALAQRVIDS